MKLPCVEKLIWYNCYWIKVRERKRGRERERERERETEREREREREMERERERVLTMYALHMTVWPHSLPLSRRGH